VGSLQLVLGSISAQPSLCPVAVTTTSCEPGRVQLNRRPHLLHLEERNLRFVVDVRHLAFFVMRLMNIHGILGLLTHLIQSPI
jgi:hypothetical protein